jgi:Periplasmic copper-binding protein (NosD)
MRKHILKLYIVTCLTLALVQSSMGATGQTGDLPPTPAALQLHQGGTYDLSGRVIRCEADQKVGIWAESHVALSVANAVIEGCEVGIVVTGGATEETPGLALRSQVAQVQGIRVLATNIGIWLAGNGGTVMSNIVGGAKYGFVVTGDDYTLVGNQSNDNLHDGFLVTGDRNLLKGNEARRNQGIGIHVASMAPIVGKRRALFFLQDRGLGNVIQENISTDNTNDLVEFAEHCDGNDWGYNMFRTRSPECLK